MSNTTTIVETVTPVPNTELDEATNSIFHELFDAAYEIPWYADTEAEIKGACEALNERIIQAVTNHPVLARVVHKQLLNWSLLFVACEKLHREWSHPAIKFLIEKNPSALLWRRRDADDGGGTPIHAIADHSCHCQLMGWIAETYPWVLDHRICRRHPPTFDFLDRYSRNPSCPASPVRRFFQAYPKAFSQKSMLGDTPFCAILGGYNECDADLFKWMAEEHPKGLKLRSRMGNMSVLVHVCAGLSGFEHYGNDTIEIIKYLIKECPKLVRKQRGNKALPIHGLLNHCNRRVVQNAVILLLKAYPESYTMHARFYKAPSTFPFTQRIMPLINREIELKESISMMTDVSTQLPKATSNSKDSLLLGVSNVLDSWSKDRLKTIEVELQGLPAQMAAVQKEFEGPDREESDMEDWDEDDDGENSEWDDNDKGDESEDSFDDSDHYSDEESDGDY